MKTPAEPQENIIPNHVAIIPDGTRRWAKKNNVDYATAYMLGMKKMFEFTNFMLTKGVKSISFYGLSVDNLSRQETELEPVIKAEIHAVMDLLPDIIKRFQVRVRHAGDLKKLPPAYAQAIALACELTKNNKSRTLYLLAGYDPIEEIYAAVKQAEDQQTFFEHLWVPEKVDLLIRTSGEYRISNFLPLQTGYAELVFCDKEINELDEKDWQSCLDQYKQRKRRFGT